MRTPLLSLLLSVPFVGSCASSNSARTEEVKALVDQGRSLLDAGQAAQAEPLFARALEAQDSLAVRMWLLRSWMDQGRSNDTLDALDALDAAGEKGIEMTYLYGMAFARRAEGLLAEGVSDSSVQMNFTDAGSFLKKALETDGVRFHDAWLPLARSAWFSQDLETARWAANAAVEALPGSGEAWLARGRIAMSQFVVAQKAGAPEAEGLWSDATESLRRSVAAFGTPESDAQAASLAGAATELGHGYLWKKLYPEATEAYATAIAWTPDTFDYAQILGLLRETPPAEDERPSGFRGALEIALERLTERGAADERRVATLTWWLGWARFSDADWAGAEQAFQAALAQAPEYANAWFYIGLSRQYRKDSLGALEAMHRGWEVDPSTMVASVASSAGSLGAFESLIGWCADPDAPHYLEAAFLAEMLAQAQPEEARHWNNLGLFLRDEGERLEYKAFKEKTPAPDPALLADLYGRAYSAYERALGLNPDDPQLINDTALMLHYHLESAPGEAEAMYRRAIEGAEARLADPALSDWDRERFQTTLEDARGNLEKLLHPEKEEEEEAATEPGAAAEAAAGSASDG